jgi:hypothetical protein
MGVFSISGNQCNTDLAVDECDFSQNHAIVRQKTRACTGNDRCGEQVNNTGACFLIN